MNKSISNEENRFKRINVLKIALLKDLLKKPFSQVTFNLKSLKELDQISEFLTKKGETSIKIKIEDKKYEYDFELEKKRNIDRKTINLLINYEISAIID